MYRGELMKKTLMLHHKLLLNTFIPLLLFSACFALLYHFDFIHTSLFDVLTQTLGIFFFMMLAFCINKLCIKHAFIIQFIIVTIYLLIFLSQSSYQMFESICFIAKLLVFLFIGFNFKRNKP